jgi:hypothetical protein
MGKNPTVLFQNLKEVPTRNNETGEVLTDGSGEAITMPNPRCEKRTEYGCPSTLASRSRGWHACSTLVCNFRSLFSPVQPEHFHKA